MRKNITRTINKGQSERGQTPVEPLMRWLTVRERQDLRRDMAESSAWARAELKRRREAKAKQNAEHGTNNGTTTEPSPKQP